MSLSRSRKGSRIPFDKPGKATAWGMAGCLILAVSGSFGFGWAVAVTVVTALAGCYKGT
jgi:hypothetical protein